MASLNQVNLIGNMTRDPELRYTGNGVAVVNAVLAVNRVHVSVAGERKEETAFVEFQVWGRLAEITAEKVKKGHLLFLEGRLMTHSWEDKTTKQRRSRLTVVGENLQFLERPKAGGEAEPAAEAPEVAA